MNRIGVDIGGTTIKFAVLDDNGKILERGMAATPKHAPDNIAAVIRGWIYRNADSFQTPIGIACAGTIDPTTGLLSADNLGIQNAPFSQILEKEIGVPVLVSQDAHAAMIAEWKYGNLQGVQNGVYLVLGTGIGGDAIVNGVPYRDTNYKAMEFGHMILVPNGERCPCGERGCFERYASASALARMTGMSPKDAIAKARLKDPFCQKIWREYISALCTGIITICRILQPEKLVIGGGISQSGPFFETSIREEMEHHSFWKDCATEITLGKLGNDAGVIGAVYLAENHSK